MVSCVETVLVPKTDSNLQFKSLAPVLRGTGNTRCLEILRLLPSGEKKRVKPISQLGVQTPLSRLLVDIFRSNCIWGTIHNPVTFKRLTNWYLFSTKGMCTQSSCQPPKSYFQNLYKPLLCLIWFFGYVCFLIGFFRWPPLSGLMKTECKLRDVLQNILVHFLFTQPLAFARFRGSKVQLCWAKMESRAKQFVGFLHALLKTCFRKIAQTRFVHPLPKECNGLMAFCQNTSTCLPAFLRVPLSKSTWPTLPLNGTQ